MSIKDREQKSKSVSPVSTFVNSEEKEEPELHYRSFHLETCHVKALAFEKAETGKALSEIVREALDLYFGDKLDQYR